VARCGKLLGELAQLSSGLYDGGLVGEDLVAVLVAQGLAPESNQRALTAASGSRRAGQRKVVAHPGNLVLGRGLLSRGLARPQSGHSMSANSTMATRAPAGGLSAEVSCTWVPGGGAPNWAWAPAAAKKRGGGQAQTGLAGRRRAEEGDGQGEKRDIAIGRLPK
jgi:hypothetical protein